MQARVKARATVPDSVRVPETEQVQDLGQGSVQDWAQQKEPGQETAPRLV